MLVDIIRNYKRFRIRNPILFKKDSFRTLDIGRIGFHKLIRGRLRKNNEWKTQSVIVERKYANLPEVKKETNEIIRKVKREK